MPYFIYVIITAIILLPGIASIFLMILPSFAYMFLIVLVFGFIDKFQHLTILNLIILGGIAIIAEIIDYISGIYGAKIGGASKRAIIFGIVGFILGLTFFPPFGGIIGLFLGILLTEIIYFKDYIKALKAASGGLLGTIAGTFIKLILSILFLISFIIFAL